MFVIGYVSISRFRRIILPRQHVKVEKIAAHNREAPILQLHPELLLTVSDLLPTSSAICLALICRAFYHGTLTKSTWSTIQARQVRVIDDSSGPSYEAVDSTEHLKLLKLLERDNWQYELCHYCLILHINRQPLPRSQ